MPLLDDNTGEVQSQTVKTDMLARVAAVWICVLFSCFCSAWLYLCASFFGNFRELAFGGKPIPQISEWFYPPAFWAYLFPLVFICWGIWYVVRLRRSTEHALLICSASIVASIIFFLIYLVAVALPFMAIYSSRHVM